MTDELRRSINRGVALLLLPLTALVRGSESHVWSDDYAALGVAGEFGYVILPTALFVGAFLYLVVSAVRQASKAVSDTESG